MKETSSVVFAGDRQIAVDVLDFIHTQKMAVSGLYVTKGNKASHSEILIEKCSYLRENQIFRGNEFKTEKGLAFLNTVKPDYILGIHFPYIIPGEVLRIPRRGVVNLHPAYLPFNRGWHTPSWAILDKTPIGATLHFMDEGIDTGDIIFQRQVEIEETDTADSLYQKVLQTELQIIKEVWPSLMDASYKRTAQIKNAGTKHSATDLFSDEIRFLDTQQKTDIGSLLDRLRALTTNDRSEAAYFIKDGRKYAVTIDISELKEMQHK